MDTKAWRNSQNVAKLGPAFFVFTPPFHFQIATFPSMSDQLVSTPVIGSITHDWAFMERVLKLPGVVATDLVTMHQALGAGTYCGAVRLFECVLLNRLHPADFIIESVENFREVLVIGEEDSGRSIAVGSDGERAIFYLIDWKADCVETCVSLHDALLKLSEWSDSIELFAKPFHLSNKVGGPLFKVSCDFDVAAMTAGQAADASSVGWRYPDTLGQHFLLFDEAKTFLVDIMDGRPLRINLNYDYENGSAAEAFFERWSQLMSDLGLEKPVQSF